MSSVKRHRSSDTISGEERDSKHVRAESNDATAANASLPGAADGQFRIDVQLGSVRKAARNDPKPTPPPWHDVLRDLMGAAIDGARVTSDIELSTARNNDEPAGDPVLGTRDHGGDDDENKEAGEENENQEVSLDDDYVEGENADTDSESDEDEYGEDGYDDHSESDNWSDYDEGDLWLENIYGTATSVPGVPISSTDRKVGSCHARLIRRDQMRESFWLEMEMPSQETADLAFDLFDRYGRLQSDYCDHDIKRGTGVWGKELNHGDILLFEEIKVDRQWKRQGIAGQMVNAILEKTRKKVDSNVGFFSLVRPGYLTREVESSGEPWQTHLEIARSFWKSLGFRRVGASPWLAWTDSTEHPSRHLEPGQDCQELHDLPKDPIIPHHLKELHRKLTNPEADEKECISELQAALSNDLQNQKWSVLDHHGNTLLHVTALGCKPELVRIILAEAPQTVTLRNSEGYTPAEALQKQLEDQRTKRTNGHRFAVVSDNFSGYEASAIACVAAFRQLSAFDLSTLSPRDIEAAVAATTEQIRRLPALDIPGIRKTLQLKYGCTCGECLGGFISPRMKFALLCKAETDHDLLNDEVDDYTGREWVRWNEDSLKYLPSSVRDNLETNKSMRQGFTNMFDHFAECLRRERIPSESEVLSVLHTFQSEWPPVTRTFLQRGGSVASVATVIFERAMEQAEWSGDGDHEEVFAEQVARLPSCRNDHEFGFVSGTCGYKRVRPITSRFVDMLGRDISEPYT